MPIWQTIFNPPETWYLAILAGVYPLFGFVLIGEGIVRFGLLMVSRRFKSGRIYRIQDALSMLGEYTRANSTGIMMLDEPCE